MMRGWLFVACSYVVPVEPEGVVLDHHTVVVNAKGDIEAVLPTDEAKRTYRSGEEVCDAAMNNSR